MESEFPSNSKSNKARAKEEPKKIEKVVVGEVIARKKPISRRLSETFFGGDARNAGAFVFFDVFIPATKDMVADMMSQGMERMLFGEVRSTSRRGYSYRPGERNHTPYNRMSSPGHRRADEPRGSSRKNRAVHNFDEFILATRGEAMEVLARLDEQIATYEVTTVADLYDLLGHTGAYTDSKWGWVDLRDAQVRRVPNGYLLDLPRPEPID